MTARLQITASAATPPAGRQVVLRCIANGTAYVEDGYVVDDYVEGGTAAGELQILTDVDTDLIDQVQPSRQTGVQTQRVGWYVRITNAGESSPGLDVGAALTPEGVTVRRSLDSHIQQASFALDYATWEYARTSPNAPEPREPHNNQRFDIGVRVQRSDGAFVEIPLITDGYAESVQRHYGEKVYDEIVVADRGGRFAPQKVTRRFPAGSNVQRARAVRLLASDAGVSSISLPRIPGRLRKQTEIAKGDWLSLAQQIVSPVGGRILWNREGELTCAFDAPELGPARVSWTFGPDDFLAAVDQGQRDELTLERPPEGYTYVGLIGKRQVELDGNGGCVVEVTPTSVEVTEPDKRVSPLGFDQNTSGTVSANSETPITRDTVVSRVEVQTTTECDEVVGEVREVYALGLVERARRYLDATTADLPVGGYFSGHLAEDDPNAKLYTRRWPTLHRVEREVSSRIFDDQDYLLEERTETESYYNPLQAIKARTDPSVSWESQAGIGTTLYQLGSGEVVTETRDRFITTRRVVKRYERDGAFLKSTLEREWGFKRKAGTTYLYSDGETGSESEERFEEIRQTRTSYSPVSETRHRETSVETTLNGRPKVTAEVRVGAAPAAPRKADAAPVREDYDTDEDFEAALTANRFDLREMRAQCFASDLINEAFLIPNELHEVASQGAETEGELRNEACRLILQSIARTVRFSIPCNPLVEEGQGIRLLGPGYRFDERALVVDVKHSGPTRGPIVTSVEAVIYTTF